MRSYKLLEINSQYGLFLRSFYLKNPEYVNWAYDELLNRLTYESFGESDFIHNYLSEMGIESKVIFFNNRNLQDKSPLKKRGCRILNYY